MEELEFVARHFPVCQWIKLRAYQRRIVDEIVLRSMLKWPDVPAAYGWLGLDRRGNWLIKAAAGRLERIANAAVAEFIGRNYAVDAAGCWYFQNGPQRVFVALDYTPWIWRLDDAGAGFLAHTGAAPRAVRAAFLDETGALLLETDLGIGVVLDRELAAVLERFAGERGGAVDRLIESVMQGSAGKISLHGSVMPVSAIRAADVPARFGFVLRPAPGPGEPEC
jgi:Protein of unknown function (DUF2946)